MKNQIFLLILTLIIFSCKNVPQEKGEMETFGNFEPAQEFYLSNLNQSIRLMDSLAQYEAETPEAKEIFIALRSSFKKAEPYAAYLNPEIGHRVNGPALPIFTDDTQRVLNPIGLQKIEESIFEGGTSKVVYKKEVSLTKGLLKVLQDYVSSKKLDSQRFFIATHQQLFRIVSLGISGFDTPVSQLGLQESAISLESLLYVYKLSIQNIIQEKNTELDQEFEQNIIDAVAYLNNNTNFEAFDRFTFIRDYMNPITRNWVEIRKTSKLWEGTNNKPFNFDAPTFFEKNSFNKDYFMPVTNRNATPEQIDLGEKLFFDPNLSATGKMSCATCHSPEKAYTDGLMVNLDNEGEPLKRNTPTLINSVYQRSFFWDGRSPTIMNQISEVFSNTKEFNSNVHQFSDKILKDTTYNSMFRSAFGKIPTKNSEIIKAISSYVASLNGFNSKFDRNIRGEIHTITEKEKLGFNIFMGKGLCATCHFIPLTNGTVPPFFAETEKEVIGVPETAANRQLDDDLGFYWMFQEELHRGMFKTPTLRNVALTAPYMHNGVYNSLPQVMEFYNLGGGGGMGFDLPHQTLPFDELNLNKKELDALVAFMKTLTDTAVEEYEASL
ncbi:cytochrome-c peroxidase [Galbibacter sp. BG1]|uniref:cytochrome-c peroxidase n=1 Tax=Galbibacter sp. BG1 TaxID=1170699 RepID=UPI0015B929F3|nr:cytochrome c peroxidase [Galbibacter sp. BG1]QLE02496.1 cytochrome-c peroxidase [Galbibacter sp. BG1]